MTKESKIKGKKKKKKTTMYLLELPSNLHREIKIETIEKNYAKISDYITDILKKRIK